ncbi:putative pentatricopeptide repeat-containing protein At1g16830 [Gossypium raimondii]|uniref:Pentacotripeptide-repeat region of PRORP domain-containing protein n=1 Tax=Gossypium raimondii TaxID=29730 RepID=A0A0D2VU68_GOSRA|nr:putative pentatricopeptide repeat-containing protein At1g16830 [Gossypium raimondii]XP_012460471.1 putative pentatricopeptide repeat-containing protein At1g16830 [Gossypium raimondii]XP_012460475.1 putative pentatricopeptide repeat-containing protein At1g16830 [Gossypium raimondii]XP_012460476.1 putative pentatricopeptide repeat-containing protein At1g16830 [Gossypium raimondii]XP_012460477.1 putative pentatricopeptide repeat-containing protein At1g16830 [Gossypium raimondii]KJB74895.1 hypo
MIWRCRWGFLPSTPATAIFASFRLISVRLFSAPEVSSTDKSQAFSGEKKTLIINPQIVHSTLLNCPSNLIALSFFLWCAKQPNYFHDVQAFDCMVNVVSQLTKKYLTVRRIVGELENIGCVIKPQTFLLLLRIYWRSALYGMVFETFHEMAAFGFTPNTFARNVVMDVLYRIGHVDKAIKVLNDTHFPNFLTFNIALCNLCKLSDLSNISYVSRRMIQLGYYPNVKTFEMILNCFCKMGRLAEAYQVLGLMITLGASVSMNVWSILIDGFCRLHQPGLAYALFKKMLRTGCSPNLVIYTSLIKGFLDSRMVNSASSILNRLECDGYVPDLVLCNVLIDCLSKVGRYDDAFGIFLSLSDRNLVPDSYTFCSLLSNICLSRRFSLLPNIASGLAIEGDLMVCNSLLNYFCKAGYPLHAVQLYDYMLARGLTPDKYSFVGLLSGLCGAGRFDEAVNVYQALIRYYPGLDAHVHTVIVDRLIRVGKYHRAFRLFRRALEEKYPLDVVSYNFAIYGLFKSGRIYEAYTLYSQMKEVGVFPNAHTYNLVISGFCKGRDLKMVKQLMQEISKTEVELDHHTINSVIKLLFRSYPYPSDLNQLIEMCKSGLIPDEAMYAQFSKGLASGINIGHAQHSLMRDQLLVDPSSSDDIPDVAASVG